MKICYLISAVSSDNTGRGGHYESLKVLAESMVLNGVDVEIIALGDIFPPTFKDISVNVKFIEFKPDSSLLGYILSVRRALLKLSPDVIHSFDNKSYFFARVSNLSNKIKLVLTKPGGPNPKIFFPYCSDLVLFSKENYSFFREKRKYRKSRLHYIPNRARKIESDFLRINEIKNTHPINGKVFLRIARISEDYKETFYQLINLVDSLNKHGFACTLFIIGFVQDESLKEELIALKCSFLHIITEEKYTRNASQLIELCDFFLGTGRGVYEAALLERVVLGTVKGAKYPVLISENNFAELQHKNFSPRTVIEGFAEDDQELHFNAILNILNSDSKVNKLRDYIRRMASDNFDIESVTDEYKKIYYMRLPKRSVNYIDLLLNFVVVFKVYFSLKFMSRVRAGR